jgi:SET domain-containing protein
VTVDGEEHIIIFAKRDIEEGEELSYDYRFMSHPLAYFILYILKLQWKCSSVLFSIYSSFKQIYIEG